MLQLQSNIKTMSSREISELTGSSHEAVKKSAVRLSAGKLITSPLADTPYTAANKQTYYEILFNKRDSFVIVAQLSPEFTAAVVDRWQELESAEQSLVSIPDFNNPAAAARAWASQYEEKTAALQLIEEQAPKVDFYNQVTDSTDAIDMASAAKVLNIKGYGRNKLFAFLRENKVLQDNNQPYQSQIDANRMRVIESKFVKPNGDTCINLKTVVYQRGLDHIRKLLAKG